MSDDWRAPRFFCKLRRRLRVAAGDTRVGPVCLRCRQKKIKCDGRRPWYSCAYQRGQTCTVLNRVWWCLTATRAQRRAWNARGLLKNSKQKVCLQARCDMPRGTLTQRMLAVEPEPERPIAAPSIYSKGALNHLPCVM
eukprot:964763-Rhodomonas_salina.4